MSIGNDWPALSILQSKLIKIYCQSPRLEQSFASQK